MQQLDDIYLLNHVNLPFHSLKYMSGCSSDKEGGFHCEMGFVKWGTLEVATTIDLVLVVDSFIM